MLAAADDSLAGVAHLDKVSSYLSPQKPLGCFPFEAFRIKRIEKQGACQSPQGSYDAL